MTARRDAAQAVLLLAATTAAAMGWVWADDRPRAGAALAFGLALVLTAMLKARVERLTRLVCAYGMGYQASGMACVVWFPELSSRDVGVCDEGTGLPVGLLYCIGALLGVPIYRHVQAQHVRSQQPEYLPWWAEDQNPPKGVEDPDIATVPINPETK